MRRRLLPVLCATLLLTGCATAFKETHYFRAVDPETNKPVNYFRIQIEGETAMTKSRYVSGFYNQRAVEYFFNEFRTTGQPELRLEPVGNPNDTAHAVAEGDDGSFVLILSTNAKSVADTIGEMTDNEALGKAFNRLLRGSEIEKAERFSASVASLKNDAHAGYDDIDAAVAQLVEVAKNGTRQQIQQQSARVVAAVARALDGEGDVIKDYDDAKRWLEFAKQRQKEAAK